MWATFFTFITMTVIFRPKGISKLEEIQSLKAGDMILLNGKPRLIRKVSICQNNSWIHAGKPYYFYFCKKRKSQYPSASTLYNIHDMKNAYGGLLKRGCDLVLSEEEAVLQYSIENSFDGNLSHNEQARKADKYGMYASQNEAAGKFR